MRRTVLFVGLGVGAIGLAAALYWFQPQTLLIDTVVADEPPPAASPAEPPAEAPAASPAETPATAPGRSGVFEDRSHPTSGRVRVVDAPDGSTVLRLEDLETDNGPDLYVYLSAAGPDADAAALDDDAIDLGRLKGNRGDQNYVIPPGTDLDRYATVVIWCDRFTVAFGVAELAPA